METLSSRHAKLRRDAWGPKPCTPLNEWRQEHQAESQFSSAQASEAIGNPAPSSSGQSEGSLDSVPAPRPYSLPMSEVGADA
jgi:hypothetical protein